MKAIMVMFDSLNRHMLPPYGSDGIHAPNFARLAERTVTFDSCYVGSMPCMPARRDLHTGRYNFLHRSWGPLEPFDDSMPELLKRNGIYTHLVSDHYHYWETGGATYHTSYSSWEFSRGQEGDPWKGHVADPEIPEIAHSFVDSYDGRPMWRQELWRHNWVNRQHMRCEPDQPQPQTFANALEFIRTNHQEDNWFLQIETFDPHEPFITDQHYKDLYPHEYDGPHFDWPPYNRITTETPLEVQHMRFQYAALVSMCDRYLGEVLAIMDELALWDDTLLIVCTDHGFLLGEHDWWAKVVQPFYQEVAHIPLFVWDPRSKPAGERRDPLVQMIDFPATLLEYFNVERPPTMQGLPLGDVIANNAPTRPAVLFGIHGGQVNVTDGQYVYMRAPARPDNKPLFNYTLMPTNMRNMFSVGALRTTTLAEPFAFTKGCKTMRIDATFGVDAHSFGTLLFDVLADPLQAHPLTDAAVEDRMIEYLKMLMAANDAPVEQYDRLGLSRP